MHSYPLFFFYSNEIFCCLRVDNHGPIPDSRVHPTFYEVCMQLTKFGAKEPPGGWVWYYSAIWKQDLEPNWGTQQLVCT